MSEQELKNFILVYQQKLNELMAQNIALEAKMMNANQIIEALSNKIKELESSAVSKRTNKKSEPGDFE